MQTLLTVNTVRRESVMRQTLNYSEIPKECKVNADKFGVRTGFREGRSVRSKQNQKLRFQKFVRS